MSEAPRDWEGQVVDGIFPLKKYLGGSDHSAVFLTEYAEGEGGRAALKLLPAERATADLQLTNWRFTAQLAHPNLLRLFRAGRCRIEGNDLLYVVMEHADEDLADILPERPLAREEAREMLNPVLDALEYLHGKGLVHGALKPTNILAMADQLKLSSDMVSRAGETQGGSRKTSVYDAPEAVTGMKTPESDVWALGTTLVEVLTQEVPEWQPGPNREPVVTEAVPAPFAEIARACLRLEPRRRLTVADIAERLNSRAAAASAAGPVASVAEATATAATQEVPTAASLGEPALGASAVAAARGTSMTSTNASSVASAAAAAIPAAAAPARAPYAVDAAVPPRPTPRTSAPADLPSSHRAHAYKVPGYGAPKQEADRNWTKYLGGSIAALFVLSAIFLVPRFFSHSAQSSTANLATGSAATQPSSANAAPRPLDNFKGPSAPATKKAKPVTKTSSAGATPQNSGNSAAAASSSNGDSLKPASAKAATTETTDSIGAGTGSAAAQPVSAHPGATKGDVLDQVLPDVSAKARATIHGHVRVAVKVHVDAAGAVSTAALDSAGPSAFFADAALKAARQWAFTPPEVNGKSVPSDWVLHFVFTSADTKVTPNQTAP
jgi:TonB family protein